MDYGRFWVRVSKQQILRCLRYPRRVLAITYFCSGVVQVATLTTRHPAIYRDSVYRVNSLVVGLLVLVWDWVKMLFPHDANAVEVRHSVELSRANGMVEVGSNKE